MALIYCDECGKEISDKALSCPYCGCPVKKMELKNSEDVVEKNETGIPNVPYNDRAIVKKKRKTGRIVVIALLLFFVTCCIAIGQKITEEYSEKNPAKSELEEVIGCSQKEAKKVEDYLDKCKVINYSSIAHDKLLDGAHMKGEKGYRIEMNDGAHVIMYLKKDNELYLLKYNTYKLFKGGKVLATVSDFSLTSEEKNNLQYSCQEKIKEILKSPSTAKFPNILEWYFEKKKEIILVQGYVDSQNGFGAEIRSEFQFKIDKKTKTIKSLIFDGKELIK